MSQFLLKLYIAGRTPRTENAIASLKEICDRDLSGQYQLAVIDVLERPQLAENEKILATPTLVKELPPPLRRVVGDLSDRDRVLVGLDLSISEFDSDLGGELSSLSSELSEEEDPR